MAMDYGLTALSFAAFHGHAVVVRLLLEHGGVNVNSVNRYGATPLHGKCIYGRCLVLRLLLEAGADPTLRDVDGRTALDLSARNDRQECITILQEWDRAYLLQRIHSLRDAAPRSLFVGPQGS